MNEATYLITETQLKQISALIFHEDEEAYSRIAGKIRSQHTFSQYLYELAKKCNANSFKEIIDNNRKEEREKVFGEIRNEWIPELSKTNEDGIRMIVALRLEGKIDRYLYELNNHSNEVKNES